MTLSLDHIQRLNLIALLDLVECPGRREAWAVGKLQDLLDLDEEERQTLELHKVVTEGRENYQWNGTKTIAPRTYTLATEDIARISRALDKMPGGLVLGRDRWFKPLQAQLPEPEESNGA